MSDKAFSSLKDKNARAQAKLIKEAEKLYLKAAESSGNAYIKKMILAHRPELEEELDQEKKAKVLLFRKQKISEVVDKTIQNKGQLGEKYNQVAISKVPEEIAALVSRASDGKIDISEKNVAINGTDLWHEYNSRSKIDDELSRQQIPFTPEQIKEAIEAIYNPDWVESVFSSKENPTQRQSFAYAKKSPDGHYIAVEAVGGKTNPNIVPVMILQFSEEKWNKMLAEGKTLGELFFENDTKKLNALDVEFNKRNRVIAAQFASKEAIANTPHSPRFNNSISHSAEKSTENAKKVSGSEKDVSFDLKESTKKVDSYTEKEYNNYGWVRANDILTPGQMKNFEARFAKVKSNQLKVYKSKQGEYMIPVSDIYDYESEGIENAIVYVKGSIDSPIITRILKIDLDNETSLDEKRREIYALERRGIQPTSGELFRFYSAVDFRYKWNEQGKSSQTIGYNNQFGSERGRSGKTAPRFKGFSTNEDGSLTFKYDDGHTKTVQLSRKSAKDTVSISKGALAKIKANYKSDKVFSKNDVAKAINSIEAIAGIRAQLKNELVNRVWRGYNENLDAAGYEKFTEVMYHRIHATVIKLKEFSIRRTLRAAVNTLSRCQWKTLFCTAGRINGLERPNPNEGYALKSSASIIQGIAVRQYYKPWRNVRKRDC